MEPTSALHTENRYLPLSEEEEEDDDLDLQNRAKFPSLPKVAPKQKRRKLNKPARVTVPETSEDEAEDEAPAPAPLESALDDEDIQHEYSSAEEDEDQVSTKYRMVYNLAERKAYKARLTKFHRDKTVKIPLNDCLTPTYDT